MLANGCDYYVLSTGDLVLPSVLEQLKRAAVKGGSQIRGSRS